MPETEVSKADTKQIGPDEYEALDCACNKQTTGFDMKAGKYNLLNHIQTRAPEMSRHSE